MGFVPEVRGAIVGRSIGIFGASATVITNRSTLTRRLESKNRRRLAEFSLDGEVEALAPADDGRTEFPVDVAPHGRAPFHVVGRRDASEGDLRESPSVAGDVGAGIDRASAHVEADDSAVPVEA